MRIVAFAYVLLVLFYTTAFCQTISDLNVEQFEQMEAAGTLWRTDPFAPKEGGLKNISVQSIVLTGVVKGRKGAYALVNGHTVKKGDVVAGYRVVDITLDGITLRSIDGTRFVPLHGGL